MSAKPAVPEEERSRSLKPLLRRYADLIARSSAASQELARRPLLVQAMNVVRRVAAARHARA